MKRIGQLGALFVLTVGGLQAQTVPEGLDLGSYQRQAASVFNPSFITAAESPLGTAFERLLLVAQAIAAVIVIAGLLTKMRKDHEPMEGMAAMLLKVAFIATVTFWRGHILDTADAIADTIGYRAAATTGTPTAYMTEMWSFAGQWMPPGSPYLDALETQAGGEAPASGNEADWATHAWNWARGVGTTTADSFQALWQTLTGSLRALFVLVCCAAMTCCLFCLIALTYLGEIVRTLLFYVGFALAPIFIAGLGVEILKQQSIRFLLGLGAVACWPIGWALGNCVTSTVLHGIVSWMNDLKAAAAGLPVGTAPLPSIALMAPYLAWGVIFLFVALTLVVCAWSLATLVLGPILISRCTTRGANVVGGFVGVALPGTTNVTGATQAATSTTLAAATSQSHGSSTMPPSSAARPSDVDRGILGAASATARFNGLGADRAIVSAPLSASPPAVSPIAPSSARPNALRWLPTVGGSNAADDRN